ncbi:MULTISPECIES: DinB family protein [unclassified Paludibacterium]|uniref:DinB family protein n=1 Tax=unclassified Paludibacterium TaxID=2618429 RepID=UPI001C05316F|nr:DinB family protein [Paludibacterium sp. B53371]BEV70658.1 DinB family protein [Paludibacterium sp. THUN1379]
MNLNQHFLSMAYNNAWANHRLLKACASLSQDDYIAPRCSFFPSLRETFQHLLVVDQSYLSLLEHDLVGKFDFRPDFSADGTELITLAQLDPLLREAGERLIAYCRQCRDDMLGLPLLGGNAQGLRYGNRARLLAHLFQHQIHHRGQIHAMLAGTRVAPPQLDDFFRADDEAARAGDLAELGWCEADLWSVPR